MSGEGFDGSEALEAFDGHLSSSLLNIKACITCVRPNMASGETREKVTKPAVGRYNMLTCIVHYEKIH